MSSFLLRAFNCLGEQFDRRYRQSILAGLVACLWFSVFASAAHDLWAACLIFGVLTFLVLVLLMGHFRTRRPIQFPVLGPMLLVLFAFCISSNYSFDVVSSRFECWVWFYSFIGFYLLYNAAQTPLDLDDFFVTSSYVLLPLALLCIYLRMNGTDPDIHATLINSIILSGFVLNWTFFLWDRGVEDRLNATLLSSAFVILLLCRSWWAGFSLAFGFIYYYKEVIKSIYIKRRSAFLLSIFMLFVSSAAIVVYKFSFYQIHGSPYSNRIAWWMAALRMAGQHPLIGVGLGAYSTAYPYFYTGKGLNSLYAHNFPLQLLSETGIVGMTSLLGFAFVLARRIQSRRVFMATLITIFSYSLVHINVEYFLNKIVVLFLLVTLIKSEPADWKVQPGQWMVVSALVMLLLIPSWYIPWIASTYYVEGTRQEENRNWSNARVSYQNAARLDPVYGDAYAGLARISAQAYRESGSAVDLSEWRAYLAEAFLWKKSVHVLADLGHRPS
jgi:O-antigen ligase